MDITKSLNKAMEYVERNLDKEIDIIEVSKIAGCSAFSFTRMFPFLAGISFNEYLRKRRLTKAGYELQNTDKKILDLSLKYGYESPTSFNRAFASHHGVAPSKARKQGTTLRAYMPITFSITIKGVVAMEFKIEEREGFRAVGFKRRFRTDNGENFREIPKMWEKAMSDETYDKLITLNNVDMRASLGICANMEGYEFDYYIATPSSMEEIGELEEIIIKPQLYAVFPCALEDIQEVTKRIFSEWLPNSEYKHASAPEIEVYYQDCSIEILIPIQK